MSQPATAEGSKWVLEAREELVAWASTEGEESAAALRRSCQALENLLGDEPSYAADIQQLALSPMLMLKAVEPEAALRMGDVGLRASLLLPEPGAVDTTRTALLELGGAEAAIVAGRYFEAEAHLDAFDRRQASLASRGVMSRFLRASADCLRGRLHEEGLELEKAAAAYEAALDGVTPLVTRAAQRTKAIAAWIDAVIGQVEPDQQEGAAATVMRMTVAAVFVWALLGRGRVHRGASDAELMRLLRRTLKAVPEHGVPEGLRVHQLAATVGLVATHLGEDKAVAFVESISDEDLEQAHLTPAEDRPVLDAAIAHSLVSRGDELLSGHLYMDALRAAQGTGSRATLARVLARYVEDMVHGPDQHNDAIESLLRYLTVWGFSSASLAEKADFEAPLSTVLDYLLSLWSEQRTPANRLRLGILLDLMMRPQWVPLPSSWDLDRAGEDVRSLSGLWFAMDWLGRLQTALRRHPRTAVIVIRSGRDRVVFLCASDAEDELIYTSVPSTSQQATHELADAARAELDFVLLSGATSNGDLEEVGRAAFQELPDEVREVIRNHELLLVIPNVEADSESAPFELLHDGDAYLGLSKVVSRVPSLRDAVRILEGGVGILPRQRGLVAAAPDVEDAPPLLYATSEVEQVRLELEAQGWDAPVVEPKRLGSQYLVDRLAHVAVAHLAAHGVSTAGNEALLLPADRLTVELLLQRRPARLPFVYLNSCFLGTTRYLGGGARRGLAHAFTELGAPAIVASLSPVDDRVGVQLSAAFYDEAREHPVGEALRRARRRLAESGVAAPLWGTTVLFGDPTLRLFKEPEEPTTEPHSTDRILDAFANPEPEHWSLERYPADAILAPGDEPDDPRLRAAALLMGSLAKAGTAEDPRAELHFAVELADQLGHSPTSALLRMRSAEQLAGRGDTAEAASILETALPIFDSLHEIDSRWDELRLQAYGRWKRLDREERGEGEIVLESDGTEEELNARLNNMLGSQAIAEKSGGQISFRTPERNLTDIAWNAVRLGDPWRFYSLRSRAEAGALIAQKLERAGHIPKASPWTSTLVTGILDYLWRGLAPLDLETMSRSTEIFVAAVEDIGTRWVSPPGEPWLDSVLDFQSEVRTSVWVAEALPSEQLEALLQQTRRSLGDMWHELAAKLSEDYPEAVAGCAAFAMGAVIEAHAEVLNQDGATSVILNYLRALLTRVEGSIEHAGLLAGYEPESEASEPDELDRWRREEHLTGDFATRVRRGG